jgi:hypothetical protein
MEKNKKKIIKYLWLFVWAMLLMNANTSAQKLHLIFVGDTRDPEIGNAASASYTFYERIAESAVKYAELQELKKYKMIGDNMSKEYLNNLINNLQIDEKDIILFYASTHGWNDNTSEYPRIVLETDAKPSTANSVNITDIYDKLRSKNARLTIVFGEACNNQMLDRPKVGPSRTATHPPVDVNVDYFKDLFRRSKMSILACSSSKGQVSISDREEGGRFTQAFYSVFGKYTSNTYKGELPTWDKIMNETRLKTNAISMESGSGKQIPMFEIEILGNDYRENPVVVDVVKPMPNNLKLPITKTKNSNGNVALKNYSDTKTGTPITTKPASAKTAPNNKNCFNNTSLKSIIAYQRFMDLYWKNIENTDLDEAKETFSTQIYTEDIKEFYGNLSQKLEVEYLINDSEELNNTGTEILTFLEEINLKLESNQFQMKASSKLAMVLTDLNRIIKKVESIKRLCAERN